MHVILFLMFSSMKFTLINQTIKGSDCLYPRFQRGDKGNERTYRVVEIKPTVLKEAGGPGSTERIRMKLHVLCRSCGRGLRRKKLV